MSDTEKKITFEDIVNIGKRRVDDTTTVPVTALGGSVVLRQISGAEQDAAVAAGHAAEGGFDQHAVARAQIKASLVEPALPPDEFNPDGTLKRSEANEIIDNLPVGAFGELQSLVQANSGLYPGVGVEQMVAMFRGADQSRSADGDGSAGDSGSSGDEPEGVGHADAGADEEPAGVLPGDEPDAGDGSEAAGEAAGATAEAAGVTA